MNRDRYTGPIGPPGAMSALAPEFTQAYSKAAEQMLAAVLEFERVTGRVVDQIALERIDVTQLMTPGREFIRQTSLHFLPKPGEVAW
jgi:hypothetical protein